MLVFLSKIIQCTLLPILEGVRLAGIEAPLLRAWFHFLNGRQAKRSEDALEYNA